MIACNGKIVAQGSQFSLNDVEVITATLDLEDVRSHRAVMSRNMQAASSPKYHRIEVDFALSGGKFDSVRDLDDLVLHDFQVHYHIPQEEIAYVSTSVTAEYWINQVQQSWSCMLAVGLPAAFPHTRLLCPA